MSRSDNRVRTRDFLCTNDATGKRARRIWPCKEPLLRRSLSMLARLSNRGCAILFPVITEMFVLSEDNTTPRSVAPFGSWSFVESEKRQVLRVIDIPVNPKRDFPTSNPRISEQSVRTTTILCGGQTRCVKKRRGG